MAIRIDRFVKDSWLNVDTLTEASNLPLVTTVQRVYAKQINREMRLILVLEGLDRHLPLNQTNMRAMQDAAPTCKDALEWVGWELELDVEEGIEVRGEQMAGIRLHVVQTTLREPASDTDKSTNSTAPRGLFNRGKGSES